MLILFAEDQYTNYTGCPSFSEFLEFQKYSNQIRLPQTVLFLTDSVFYVLFAYFDESMSSIGWYEP